MFWKSLRRIAVIKYTSSNLELCGIGVNVCLELERSSVPLRRNCIPFVASYLKQIVSQIVLIISLSLSRPFLSTFVTSSPYRRDMYIPNVHTNFVSSKFTTDWFTYDFSRYLQKLQSRMNIHDLVIRQEQRETTTTGWNWFYAK